MGDSTIDDTAWDSGRWVLLQGFTDEEDFEKTHLNGLVAKILDEDAAMDDRYVVQVPATDDSEHIKEREFTVDKAKLVPVSTITTLAMQVGSSDFCDEAGEVIPCYEHWTEAQQNKLLSHIQVIEQYNTQWNKSKGKEDSTLPQLPEWYLYSLRASLRKWGTIPADYAETPPMKNAHERCIHIVPRGGESNNKNDGGDGSDNNTATDYRFLEVTILLKNRKWNDRDHAMMECITIVKNTVLGVDDRATLVHFEALSGGYQEPACEDTTAVFAVTKDFAGKFLPLTVIKPSGSPPQVNLRMY